MGELAILCAPCSRILIIVLALLWHVIVFVRWSSMIEWFVRINTMVPIVIFWFVGAIGCFVSVHVENDGVDRFQVELKPLLERHILLLTIITNLTKVECHVLEVYMLMGLKLQWNAPTWYLSITLESLAWQNYEVCGRYCRLYQCGQIRWVVEDRWNRGSRIVAIFFFINAS